MRAEPPRASAASRMPNTLLWLSPVKAKQLPALHGNASATSLSAPGSRSIWLLKTRKDSQWHAYCFSIRQHCRVSCIPPSISKNLRLRVPVAPDVKTHSYSSAPALQSCSVSRRASSILAAMPTPPSTWLCGLPRTSEPKSWTWIKQDLVCNRTRLNARKLPSFGVSCWSKDTNSMRESTMNLCDTRRAAIRCVHRMPNPFEKLYLYNVLELGLRIERRASVIHVRRWAKALELCLAQTVDLAAIRLAMRSQERRLLFTAHGRHTCSSRDSTVDVAICHAGAPGRAGCHSCASS